ncbi:MAG: ABC transporter substrate-binding protein [Desulfotomaculaceae bacterium]|nr:ABC transporter substrate-binding protein [Desulfotomaculaceae bacterium]
MLKQKFLIFSLFLALVLLLIFNHYIPFGRWPLQEAGATLVYARGHDSLTLDPALAQDDESNKVISNIFEGLVRFKPGTTEIEPCLAEAWHVSADGLDWTFYLKRGVNFHDGTPFNAEAVRFNVERQLPPRRTEDMAYAPFVFDMIEKISTLDLYTVRFSLKYPYAPLLHNLAMPMAAPMVSPAAVTELGEKFGSRPVGTGPFKLVKWVKEEKIILEANHDYWGEQPEFKRLVFTVVKNSRLRSLALKAGMADIIDGIDHSNIRLLEQSGLSIIKKCGLDINYLGFFTNKKPFDNAVVRRAVSMSIDREQLLSGLYQQDACAANGPLPPGVLGYDPGLRPLSYDPEGGKELLAESGHPDGIKITIITYSDTRAYNPAGGEKLAAAIKGDLARVGIEVEIKAYPWDQYKEALYKEEGNAFLYGWSSDNGDPDNFLYTLLSSLQIESGLNTAHYQNNNVDLLLVKAQRETAPKLREEMYREAVKLIMQDEPWAILNHSLLLVATAPQIEGFSPQSNGNIFLANVKNIPLITENIK